MPHSLMAFLTLLELTDDWWQFHSLRDDAWVVWPPPAVQEGEQPVVVLEEGEGVDGDGGEEEQQVEHGQGHQQPVERVLPQLEAHF